MRYNDLISATEYMWGYDAQVFNTKVDGIYNTTTARHGGDLVDIRIHPELKEYDSKTNISEIRAFEEDYEDLKVLWLYPELINNKKDAKKLDKEIVDMCFYNCDLRDSYKSVISYKFAINKALNDKEFLSVYRNYSNLNDSNIILNKIRRIKYANNVSK